MTGEEEELHALSSPSPAPEADPSDSAPPSAPRSVPPDVSVLLVRSLFGGERGSPDQSPAATVILGAQKELTLLAELLLAADPKVPEAWPKPAAVGGILAALSDRLLAGLELLSYEEGGATPPPAAAEDDEPPTSSGRGGGALPH